jgi:hypothetical protein
MSEVYADIALLGSTPAERLGALRTALRLGVSAQAQGPERLVFSGPGSAHAVVVLGSQAGPGRVRAPRAETLVLLARHGLPEESAPAFRRLAAWARGRLEAGAAGVVVRFATGDVLAFGPTGLEVRPPPAEDPGDLGSVGRWLGALVVALAERRSLSEALALAGRLAARPGAEALRRAAVRCAGQRQVAQRA